MKTKLIYAQIFVLILLTAQNLCSRGFAQSSQLFYAAVNVDSLISMNSVNAPLTSTHPYYLTMGWNPDQEGVSASQNHPQGKAFLLSIWNNTQSYTSLSITDSIISPQITLYPNPANSYFNIKVMIGKGKELRYSLFDINGRELVENFVKNIVESPFEQKINVESLPEGIYILRLQVDDQIITKKIILQKKR